MKRVGLAATMAFSVFPIFGYAADTDGMVFFEKNIRPLLADHCLKCHDGSQGKSKGGLTLDTRAGWEKGGDNGRAIVPGKPEQSLLYQAISFTSDDVQMPPKKEGGKLPDEQIALVRQWIAMGAPDPREGAHGKLTGLTAEARAHWAYQPVQTPAVPAVKDPWIKNEVDAFVLAKLRAHGLKPNPPASKEALIRRVTYDLIGLPPTTEEITAFVADQLPTAFTTVVDRLLASPHYGERWGRHWLDSARYSDTIGLKSNGGKYRYEDYRYRSAWTYRDYVVQAFNADKPWNEFLVEQLAADQLPDLKPQDPRLAALGFITVGKRFDNPDDIIDERIDTVSKAMIGVTVSCARCHDHKFDPIPTADYYALHGVFNNIDESYDLPEVPVAAADPAQVADYREKLAALTEQNRTQFYAVVSKRLADFQERAEGYLRLTVINGRSPERLQIAEAYGLAPENRDEIREVLGALSLRNEHPVIGPYTRLSRIPPEQFIDKAPAAIAAALNDKKNPVNPLVADALRDLRPRSLAEVARQYGILFARAASVTSGYIAALNAPPGSPAPTIDPALAELIAYPFPLASATELATCEQQLAFFQKVTLENKSINDLKFTAINHLRLTHPGAPGWAMTVTDKPKASDSYVFIRGEKNKKGPVVPRSYLEVLTGGTRKPFTQGSGRLELARAIADPANPLTARLVVNRAWMNHVGVGFVPTPDDLGVMSEKPIQRELFDWLTARFVADGWSLKALHRRILLSATYQQSAVSNDVCDAKDPDNRLLWRANLRRLDLEAIRDSLVMLGGHLDRTIGGKPVNISDEPYSHRRTIYGFVDRLGLSDLMVQFDFSDPEMPNSRRTNTTVPQQALFFLNSPMAADAARTLMTRSEVTGASDDAGRIQALHRILFQRAATAQEIELARTFIAEMAKPEYARGKAGPKPVAPKDTADKDKYARLINQGTMVERSPLGPWELYAQALICSNEFVYLN